MWYPLVKAEGLKMFHILEGGHGQITFLNRGIMRGHESHVLSKSHLLPSIALAFSAKINATTYDTSHLIMFMFYGVLLC
jgi:hypothetical protein